MKTVLQKTAILPAGIAVMMVISPANTFAQAKQNKNDELTVKTITIVDGDTTIVEKRMSHDEFKKNDGVTEKTHGKNVKVMVFATNDEHGMNENVDSLVKIATEDIVINMEGLADSMKMFEKRIVIEEGDGINESMSYNFDWNSNAGENVIINDDGKSGEEQRVYNFVSADGKTKKTMVINSKIIIKDVPSKNADTPSGAQEELKIEKLNFYPNPNSGNFTLEFDSPGKDPVDIRVTDINGKKVFSETVKGEGKHVKQIDLSNQSKGTYIVTLEQGKKRTTKKIIVE